MLLAQIHPLGLQQQVLRSVLQREKGVEAVA
jgi:hypothetical protein